jgi:hypothetical protein
MSRISRDILPLRVLTDDCSSSVMVSGQYGMRKTSNRYSKLILLPQKPKEHCITSQSEKNIVAKKYVYAVILVVFTVI